MAITLTYLALIVTFSFILMFIWYCYDAEKVIKTLTPPKPNTNNQSPNSFIDPKIQLEIDKLLKKNFEDKTKEQITDEFIKFIKKWRGRWIWYLILVVITVTISLTIEENSVLNELHTIEGILLHR